MGARTNTADTKYTAAVSTDASVSSGVSSGRILQPFAGFPGAAMGGDRVAMFVWIILGGAIVYALGVHWTLGRVRSLV